MYCKSLAAPLKLKTRLQRIESRLERHKGWNKGSVLFKFKLTLVHSTGILFILSKRDRGVKGSEEKDLVIEVNINIYKIDMFDIHETSHYCF